MILFQTTIENFEVFPKLRMTQRSLWTHKSKRYLQNKEQLAWLLKSRYNGKAITEDIELSFTVHVAHKRRIDADNILKAIQDALQDSGIIENDYQIKGYGVSRFFQDGKNRVVVCLKKL